MPSHPVYRAARAVVFATVCVGLAITGHIMASRASVPPLAVTGGLAVMTVVGTVLAGTERSLATIFAGLLGGQFLLHAMFAAAQHGQNLAHVHVMSPSSAGTTMTLAHVAAAAVSAWWLRRGERAVWGLARRIAAAVVRPTRALLSTPPKPCAAPSVRAVPRVATAPRATFLRHAVTRRGPPASPAALAC
jgi:hypothetical protein